MSSDGIRRIRFFAETRVNGRQVKTKRADETDRIGFTTNRTRNNERLIRFSNGSLFSDRCWVGGGTRIRIVRRVEEHAVTVNENIVLSRRRRRCLIDRRGNVEPFRNCKTHTRHKNHFSSECTRCRFFFTPPPTQASSSFDFIYSTPRVLVPESLFLTATR